MCVSRPLQQYQPLVSLSNAIGMIKVQMAVFPTALPADQIFQWGQG